MTPDVVTGLGVSEQALTPRGFRTTAGSRTIPPPPVAKVLSKPVERVLSEPTKQQIRDRAYFIYLARDGRPGDAANDWLQAERELWEEARAAGAAAKPPTTSMD